MSINAAITNTITNILHGIFLFCYLMGSLIHYFKKDNTFNISFILFFLTLFILKILGAYAHYNNPTGLLDQTWISISLLTTLLNYSITEAIGMPKLSKIIVISLSLLSSYLFLLPTDKSANFAYIGALIIVSYLIFSYYSKSLLRIGFLMVSLSTTIWVLLRQIENHIIGHEILPKYRYDNDIYHILLILSSFMIYKAIATKRTGLLYAK